MTPPASDLGRARIYFGSDFCQTLLPLPSALREACRANAGACAGFTLVTPPVNDAGLERIAALLPFLADAPGEGPAEVVVNDWGALRLVGRASGRIKPVLGRLMTRILRDPRVSAPDPTAEGTMEATAAEPQASTPYGRLLRSFGVDHVEIDSGRPGVPVDFDRLGARPSLHLGWACVARGRVCLYAALGQPDERKFTSSTPCRRECRRYRSSLTDAAAPRRAPLVSAGNAVFERHDRALEERTLACAEKHRGRVVLRDGPFSEIAWALDDLGLARKWLAAGAAR